MPVKPNKAAVEVSVGEPITLESATVCPHPGQLRLLRPSLRSPLAPGLRSGFRSGAPLAPGLRSLRQPRRAQGDESVSLDLLSESVADFEASSQNLFAQNAVTRNPVTELLIDRDAHTEINHHFSASLRSPESLGLELIPANQFSTGRCWLFAMMNTIRLPLVKKLNLPLTFELSQSYMMVSAAAASLVPASFLKRLNCARNSSGTRSSARTSSSRR